MSLVVVGEWVLCGERGSGVEVGGCGFEGEAVYALLMCDSGCGVGLVAAALGLYGAVVGEPEGDVSDEWLVSGVVDEELFFDGECGGVVVLDDADPVFVYD